jgi:hypothetical protein
MSMTLQKVQPGAPLQIPAKTYNAFVDAARDHQQRQMSTSAGPLRDRDPANVVLVKNESGADRARFDILGIAGPIFSHADNAATFQERIALRGVMPTSAHAGRFVVLVDALPDGGIGRAYVSGACLARVRMLDETHTAADVADGDAFKLASDATGTAALVWMEPVAERSDPSTAWALIRFGGTSPGGNSSTDSSADQQVLAHLKSVQRFSAENPDLPAFHWKEAWITPAGTSEEKADGNGSKTIPNCESLSVHTEDGTYATLADPVAGENLSNASIDSSTGQTLLSFLIRGTEDITHTVTQYRIQVGTGTVPGTRATYGESGDLPAAQVPTFQVAGVPLDSDVYIRVITTTSDAGTRANIYIVRLALNGESKAQVVVTDEDINDPAGAVLSSPVTGDYAGIIDEETSQTDLYLVWSPVAGADDYDVYVGSGNPPDPNFNDGWDLHWAGGGLTDTTYTVPDMPADGTSFWVTIYWRIGTSWNWNRWKVVITPAPDRRAISEDDLNRVLTETQVGLPGLTEIADGNEDAETELDIPVLVSIRETIDTVGNKRFVFQRVEQELHGVIVAESAPEADDDFTDHRYWVQLSQVSNADAADQPVTLEDATHPAARVIPVTNYAEAVAGTHDLPVGTPVMVRTVRGGTKPWITRHVMSVGGAGQGTSSWLGKIQSAGPNAEADYADARYWVQQLADTSASENDPLILAEVPVANGGKWITAHHVTEFGMDSGHAGIHAILRDMGPIPASREDFRYVIVSEINLGAGKRYVFHSYPGQMLRDQYAYLVACLQDNCPIGDWYRMTGPSIVDKAEPGACS